MDTVEKVLQRIKVHFGGWAMLAGWIAFLSLMVFFPPFGYVWHGLLGGHIVGGILDFFADPVGVLRAYPQIRASGALDQTSIDKGLWVAAAFSMIAVPVTLLLRLISDFSHRHVRIVYRCGLLIVTMWALFLLIGMFCSLFQYIVGMGIYTVHSKSYDFWTVVWQGLCHGMTLRRFGGLVICGAGIFLWLTFYIMLFYRYKNETWDSAITTVQGFRSRAGAWGSVLGWSVFFIVLLFVLPFFNPFYAVMGAFSSHIITEFAVLSVIYLLFMTGWSIAIRAVCDFRNDAARIVYRIGFVLACAWMFALMLPVIRAVVQLLFTDGFTKIAVICAVVIVLEAVVLWCVYRVVFSTRSCGIGASDKRLDV